MTPFDFNEATPDEIRVEADRRARAKAGWRGEGPIDPAMQRRKGMLLEREVQQRVVRLYARHGCTVRIYSQPRKAKFVTPGGADLQVFSPILKLEGELTVSPMQPMRPEPIGRRVMWYHETKRPVGGRYSDEQLTFAADCREAGIDVLGGGVDVAQAQLDRLGIRIPE